uniref:Notecarin-D1 n=1 Tax=Lygus hesperus TaxID=30085 RepID=A0A0A9YAY1_LYGHE
MKISISWALVILFWGSCGGDETKARQKRVLYGSPVTVYNAYQAPGYFVRIDEASTWSWLLSLIGIKPTTGDQLCGGAALTSFVVQTACHCLVVTWSITIYPYRYPVVQNGWENMLLLHHMHLVESTMTDAVWSRKFFVHQNCKQVNASQALSHDFGWIITKRPLPGTHGDKVPEGAAFAPVVTEGELAIQYYRNMKSEAICLIIGFGAYDWVKKRGNVIYGESSPSSNMDGVIYGTIGNVIDIMTEITR